MTKLRKWRFPILIGAGVIAAGALVYFSNGHIGTDKTQGAIGQRDVYRDGQVNTADVAKPGSAPVATEAILESSEFKALAKNQAFQELVHADAFNNLLATHQGLFGLLGDPDIQALGGDPHFVELINSPLFERAFSESYRNGLRGDNLFNALKNKTDFEKLENTKALRHAFANESFTQRLADRSFVGLLAMGQMRLLLTDRSFLALTGHEAFQKMVETHMTERMTERLTDRLTDRLSLGSQAVDKR
jgi:hypothetical protein